MAAITVTYEGKDYTIDQDLFTDLKERAYDRLAKTPNGMDSTIEDMDFETFRRSLTQRMPTETGREAEVTFAESLGLSELEGGLQGYVHKAFLAYIGGTPPNECVVPLTALILQFGSTDIDGNTTPLNEELWDENDVQDLVYKTAQSLQLCVSGQEQGY
jgi:hypothetical protein